MEMERYDTCCGIIEYDLLSKRGLCEFDDIINNSLGAVVGICLWLVVWKTYIEQVEMKKKNIEEKENKGLRQKGVAVRHLN